MFALSVIRSYITTMKRFWKIYFIIPVIGTLCLCIPLLAFYWGEMYFNYIRIDHLQITSANDLPVKIRIPVKFHSTDVTRLPGIPIRTSKNKRYSLRCIPEKNIAWITIVRAGVLFSFSARYEITDPKIRAELIEVYRKSVQSPMAEYPPGNR